MNPARPGSIVLKPRSSAEAGRVGSAGLGRWWPASCTDVDAQRLMARHYSWQRYADRRPRRRFVGPGAYSVLVTNDGLACFVWRVFIDDCQLGGGVNCAAFRNEGPYLSSELIREADEQAWAKWPDDRHYTYVNPAKVRSTNPGCCFKKAGWQACGRTKGGLLVLEVRRSWCASAGVAGGSQPHASAHPSGDPHG